MEFLLGGKGQGKLSVAKNRYPDAMIIGENDFSVFIENNMDPVEEMCGNIDADDVTETKNIIIKNLHLITKYCFKRGMNTDDIKKMLSDIIDTFPACVIISDEIGCGIVPMEKAEREWREETGRVQCFIAERAESVERVVCGIPVRIK